MLKETEKFCIAHKKYFDSSSKGIMKMFMALDNPKHAIRKLFPNTVLLGECPAGEKIHHAYPGGLLVHYTEMIDFAVKLNSSLYLFKDKDIFESIILHDISKVIMMRWANTEEKEKGYCFKWIKHEDRKKAALNHEWMNGYLINYFGLKISFDVYNAVCFAEGGWNVASHQYGNQPGRLAYLLHMADLYSSQLLRLL